MDKQELLDAIARSGSAGKAAYEQAQQSLGAQQAEAVRMALSSGVAGQAPAGAQTELQRIISEPYQTRAAQLTQNQATMQDWYNRLGAAQGSWADQQNALQSIALQQALAQATGGGGGGGGGDSTDTTPQNWYDTLKDKYGTWDIAQTSLASEIAPVGADWKATGKSPRAAQIDYLTSTYGMPATTAANITRIPQSAYDFWANRINEAKNWKQAKSRMAAIRTVKAPELTKKAEGYPIYVDYGISQAEQALQKRRTARQQRRQKGS